MELYILARKIGNWAKLIIEVMRTEIPMITFVSILDS
jgi:hypothetical protein